MMIDLRKQGGFCLRDRFKGLDLDHFKLVIEGQATLHAVSWAFKQLKGRKLVEMYPFLGGEGFASVFEKFMDQFMSTIRKEIEVFKSEPKVHDGLSYLHTVATPATKLCFSVPLNEEEKHFTKDSVIRKPLKTVQNEGKMYQESVFFNHLHSPIMTAKNLLTNGTEYKFLPSSQNHGMCCVMGIAGAITFYFDTIQSQGSLWKSSS